MIHPTHDPMSNSKTHKAQAKKADPANAGNIKRQWLGG
jgi:hypothetical protein